MAAERRSRTATASSRAPIPTTLDGSTTTVSTARSRAPGPTASTRAAAPTTSPTRSTRRQAGAWSTDNELTQVTEPGSTSGRPSPPLRLQLERHADRLPGTSWTTTRPGPTKTCRSTETTLATTSNRLTLDDQAGRKHVPDSDPSNSLDYTTTYHYSDYNPRPRRLGRGRLRERDHLHLQRKRHPGLDDAARDRRRDHPHHQLQLLRPERPSATKSDAAGNFTQSGYDAAGDLSGGRTQTTSPTRAAIRPSTAPTTTTTPSAASAEPARPSRPRSTRAS